MGNRSRHHVTGSDDAAPVIVWGEFVTNGVGVPSTTLIKGCIATAVRADVGTFTLTFREGFPKLLAVLSSGHVIGAGAHRAFFTALDVTAKTATLELRDATDAAADAASDTIRIALLVSASVLAKLPRVAAT